MEIKGTVIKVLPIESGVSKSTNKEWKRATIVVQYGEGQYPKNVAVSNMKNAEEFASLKEGEVVNLHIDVDSREFNGRWYTSVNCWKWESLSKPESVQITDEPVKEVSGDDLPF